MTHDQIRSSALLNRLVGPDLFIWQIKTADGVLLVDNKPVGLLLPGGRISINGVESRIRGRQQGVPAESLDMIETALRASGLTEDVIGKILSACRLSDDPSAVISNAMRLIPNR